MKTKQMFASLSFGTIVLLAGVILTGVALSEVLVFAFEGLPRWVAYQLIGGLSVIAGGIAIRTGADKAGDRIEHVEEEVRPGTHIGRHPWLAVGASMLGGFALAWLRERKRLSRQKDDDVKRAEAPGASETGRRSGRRSDPHRDKRKAKGESEAADEEESLLSDLEDNLASIGRFAGSTALSLASHMGGRALRPYVMKLFGLDEGQSGKSETKRSGRSSEHSGNGRSRAGS